MVHRCPMFRRLARHGGRISKGSVLRRISQNRQNIRISRSIRTSSMHAFQSVDARCLLSSKRLILQSQRSKKHPRERLKHHYNWRFLRCPVSAKARFTGTSINSAKYVGYHQHGSKTETYRGELAQAVRVLPQRECPEWCTGLGTFPPAF